MTAKVFVWHTFSSSLFIPSSKSRKSFVCVCSLLFVSCYPGKLGYQLCEMCIITKFISRNGLFKIANSVFYFVSLRTPVRFDVAVCPVPANHLNKIPFSRFNHNKKSLNEMMQIYILSKYTMHFSVNWRANCENGNNFYHILWRSHYHRNWCIHLSFNVFSFEMIEQ